MKRIKYQSSSALNYICGYVIRTCYGQHRKRNGDDNLYTIYDNLVWLSISVIEDIK